MELFDADLERQLRARPAKELTDAKARHARVLAAKLQVAMVNVRVALVTEARSSPKLLDHIDRATRGAFAVTQLVRAVDAGVGHGNSRSGGSHGDGD